MQTHFGCFEIALDQLQTRHEQLPVSWKQCVQPMHSQLRWFLMLLITCFLNSRCSIYDAIGRGEESVVYKGRRKQSVHYVAIKSTGKGTKPSVLKEVSPRLQANSIFHFKPLLAVYAYIGHREAPQLFIFVKCSMSYYRSRYSTRWHTLAS